MDEMSDLVVQILNLFFANFVNGIDRPGVFDFMYTIRKVLVNGQKKGLPA